MIKVAVAGAALGSRIGRFFRSDPVRLKVLVACGSAAGISAAFNAPIAGVFFSLEKVLGTFAVSAFPPILVASVIAAAVSRAAWPPCCPVAPVTNTVSCSAII